MKRIVNTAALILLIIGGLNWGLIGLFNYNIVEVLLGPRSMLTVFVYILVGIAALYYILAYFIWRGSPTSAPDNL